VLILDPKKKAFAIAALRRASYRWPGRYNAFKNGKIGRNQYKCAICNQIFGRKDVQLDHRIPIIDPVRGWQGFDNFIDRLLVEESFFQVLCKSDHKLKTQNENKVRKKYKKKKPKFKE